MDLATLVYQFSQPIATINLQRKKVYLFALTVNDISAISQINSEDTPIEKFKSLFRIFASHKKPNKTNKKRTLLPEDFINSLSLDELNNVAETFLETPYIKNINEKLKNPIQKNTDEEDIEYLYRLLIAHEMSIRERSKEMVSSILSPFDEIRKTSSILSDKLSTYDFSAPSIMEHTRTANNQRVEELEMARRTAEMTKESTNLLNVLAKGVTNFLESWRSETERNDKSTKTQLRIAAISLAISVLLSFVALYYSYKSYEQDKISNNKNDETQLEVIKQLREGNKNFNTLTLQNSNLEHRISEMMENQRVLEQKLQDKTNELAKKSHTSEISHVK